MIGHCHAAFRHGYARQRGSRDHPLARPAAGRPGRRMLMPDLPAQPVIHVAIGPRQVTMTDRNEQSVIIQLQSAHNADSERPNAC
jgi:hypothetical protein